MGANASLEATLHGAEDKTALNAHAYMVPGMLFTYNTVSPEATPLIGGWSLFKLSGDDGYGASGLRL